MRVSILAVVSLLAIACGPSAAEQKAAADLAKARKDCGRTYSSSEKVLQDMLYSRGVAEVKFAPRNEYIDKCVDLKMTSTELKCIDPNLAQGDECKALAEDSKKKVKELRDLMTSPMTKKDEKKPEEKTSETEKPAGEAGGEAAGGAEAAPEGGGE